MALPTVAAYLIAVTLFASAIQRALGISALCHQYVHLLLRCRGSDHSSRLSWHPLLQQASRVQARWKTGMEGILLRHHRLSSSPLSFVYRSRYPAGRHDVVEIVIGIAASSLLATYLLACGHCRWLPVRVHLKMWERIALLCRGSSCFIAAQLHVLILSALLDVGTHHGLLLHRRARRTPTRHSLPDKRYLPKTFFINHSSVKPPPPVLPEAGVSCLSFLGREEKKNGQFGCER